MWRRSLAAVIAAIVVGIPRATYAAEGVTVSVSTDKDLYYLASLNSSTPIVVTVSIENQTDEKLVLGSSASWGGGSLVYGVIQVIPAMTWDQTGQQTFPCQGGCKAVKFLSWLKPENFVNGVSAGYNVTITRDWLSNTSLSLNPHTKHMVGRAELYSTDFINGSPTFPTVGAYAVSATILKDAIRVKSTGQPIPPGNVDFLAWTLIKVK